MKNKWDGIIFDIDGVLVDVSQSYHKAILKTVKYFLKNLSKAKIKVSQKDISAMKTIPGFNNDWDLTFALIDLLERNIKRKKFQNEVMIITDKIKKTNEYRQVKDVFQTYYLGSTFFSTLYKQQAPLKTKKGLITKESRLLSAKIIKDLSKKYILGVATSRPRFEALFTLRNLDISPVYITEKNIVAQEDVKKEKPNPESLIEAAKRMKSKKPIYIGDTINDCIAAQKAKIPCVFIGIKKLGDFQISNVNKIKEVII